jgi:RNA polymerase sigma-70 factor (ECF subfamily)
LNQVELINSCKENNIKAQSELFHTYKDVLFSLCLKYCKNKEEAQDTLHDTFIDIFKKIKQYKHKGSFEGWLKRIAINKSIDKYKKIKINNVEINDNLFSDNDVDIHENDLDSISLDIILSLIQELPNQYRLVFNLYELDDYTHSEISKLLNISIGTSKSNLHRAKQLLKVEIIKLNKMQSKKSQNYGN